MNKKRFNLKTWENIHEKILINFIFILIFMRQCLLMSNFEIFEKYSKCFKIVGFLFCLLKGLMKLR